jgi:hypothetical protein
LGIKPKNSRKYLLKLPLSDGDSVGQRLGRVIN